MNDTIDFIKHVVGNNIERAYKIGLEDGRRENNSIDFTKVSVETFVKLYQAETLKFLEMCGQGLDDGNSPINKDMIIIWNGVACNVGNGASVSNHIVDGIENFLREDDGVEPERDRKEDA